MAILVQRKYPPSPKVPVSRYPGKHKSRRSLCDISAILPVSAQGISSACPSLSVKGSLFYGIPHFPLETIVYLIFPSIFFAFLTSTKHWADGFKEIAAISQGLTPEWLCLAQKPAFYVWIVCHHVHLFTFIYITLHLGSYHLVTHFSDILSNAALSTFEPYPYYFEPYYFEPLTLLTLWICDGVGLEGFRAGNFLGALLLSLIQVLPAHRTIFSFRHTLCIKPMQILKPGVSFKCFLAFLFPKWISILASPCL